jgi:AraC-like DNA-binding protein
MVTAHADSLPGYRDACPDPRARAPRACVRSEASTASLCLAPASLQGALLALVGRDTRELSLDAAQRLTHFPASPMVTLSWFRGMDAGLVRNNSAGPAWQPFGAQVVLEHHLAPRWQALHGRASSQPSLRQLGRHWVERLAWQAQEWRRSHSSRHVERRVKAFSGRSLREWQSIVQTESLFFSARERIESGQAFDWATLALDEGFADQAHMSRASKRVTGFAPGEFARRFIEDESFWMYRLWV